MMQNAISVILASSQNSIRRKRRKFNRNLVKRSKEVDCYQYSGITSNFYGNELSILEHSCYTSDTTDRRQATGINGENRTSRFVQFQVRAFFDNNCKYDLFRQTNSIPLDKISQGPFINTFLLLRCTSMEHGIIRQCPFVFITLNRIRQKPISGVDTSDMSIIHVLGH